MALLNSVRFLMAVRALVKSFAEETVLQAVTCAANCISCETVQCSDPRESPLSVCLLVSLYARSQFLSFFIFCIALQKLIEALFLEECQQNYMFSI